VLWFTVFGGCVSHTVVLFVWFCLFVLAVCSVRSGFVFCGLFTLCCLFFVLVVVFCFPVSWGLFCGLCVLFVVFLS